MYLLVYGYVNGDVEYYGPFRTLERVSAYAASVLQQDKHRESARWHVANLVVPYVDVQSIHWRS